MEQFEYFTNDITLLYRYIQKIKATEMKEFGLKGMHATCLYYLLKSKNGLTATELKARCYEDKGAISRCIVKLKANGFVTESQDGLGKKYRSVIQLTDLGRKVAQNVEVKVNNAVLAGSKGISSKERKVFEDILDRITVNLGEYAESIKSE